MASARSRFVKGLMEKTKRLLAGGRYGEVREKRIERTPEGRKLLGEIKRIKQLPLRREIPEFWRLVRKR